MFWHDNKSWTISIFSFLTAKHKAVLWTTKLNCMKCKFLKFYSKYLFTKYYSNILLFNIIKNVSHHELYEKYQIQNYMK